MNNISACITCDKGIHPCNIIRWYCVLKNTLKFVVRFFRCFRGCCEAAKCVCYFCTFVCVSLFAWNKSASAEWILMKFYCGHFY